MKVIASEGSKENVFLEGGEEREEERNDACGDEVVKMTEACADSF